MNPLKPLFADTWYGDLSIDALRKEIQRIYAIMELADLEDVAPAPTPSPTDPAPTPPGPGPDTVLYSEDTVMYGTEEVTYA